MRKLQNARDHLLASPLGIAADKLLTFAEKGVVTSYQGVAHHNPDFMVSYTANLILTDFAGEPLDLFFVMLQWLRRECPGAKPDALHFHVDVIDTRKVDVSLQLELTETVTAASSPAGTWLTPDPDHYAGDFTLFPGQS